LSDSDEDERKTAVNVMAAERLNALYDTAKKLRSTGSIDASIPMYRSAALACFEMQNFKMGADICWEAIEACRAVKSKEQKKMDLITLASNLEIEDASLEGIINYFISLGNEFETMKEQERPKTQPYTDPFATAEARWETLKELDINMLPEDQRGVMRKRFMDIMTLYEEAGRPDKVLEVAKSAGLADIKADSTYAGRLYINTIKHLGESGEFFKASEVAKEAEQACKEADFKKAATKFKQFKEFYENRALGLDS
jgi:hypothetical protein